LVERGRGRALLDETIDLTVTVLPLIVVRCEWLVFFFFLLSYMWQDVSEETTTTAVRSVNKRGPRRSSTPLEITNLDFPFLLTFEMPASALDGCSMCCCWLIFLLV
jgi:hypothetical protein